MLYEATTAIGQSTTTDPTPRREPLAIPSDSPAKPISPLTSHLSTPAPFRNPQSPFRNFPALPPCLQSIVTEITTSTQTPPEYAAITCLGVLSAAIGAGTELRERGRHIRPNLFIGLLSPSDPDYATAFAQAHEPLSFEQLILETNWQHCILPRLKLERESLIHARSVARRSRNHDDTSRHHELTEIERDLESIRKTHEQRPVLFVSSLTKQRLVQRLARHQGQALSILTTDPTDIAPVLGHRNSPNPAQTALTENILLAGHRGTPLSLDVTANRHIFLHHPCLSILANFEDPAPLYTPETLHHSRLLPRFIILNSKFPASASASKSNSPEYIQTETNPEGTPESKLARSAFPKRVILNEPKRVEGPHFDAVGASGRITPQTPSPLPSPENRPDETPDPQTTTNPKSEILNLKFHHRQLIKSLLRLRRNEFPRIVTATPEARELLYCYEQECRTLSQTTLSDIPAYPIHWADNAWRIALLLHTVENAERFHQELPINPNIPPPSDETNNPTTPDPENPKSEFLNPKCLIPDQDLPQLTAETATTAIALMRWYAAHQLQQLTPAREQLHLQRDPLLAKTLDCLHTNGGTATLGQLRHARQITPHQAQLLATRYPHLLDYTETPTTKAGGRPTATLNLKSKAIPTTQQLQQPPPWHGHPAHEPLSQQTPPNHEAKNQKPPQISQHPSPQAQKTGPIGPISPIGPTHPSPQQPQPQQDTMATSVCANGAKEHSPVCVPDAFPSLVTILPSEARPWVWSPSGRAPTGAQEPPSSLFTHHFQSSPPQQPPPKDPPLESIHPTAATTATTPTAP